MATFVPLPNGAKITFVWTLRGVPVTITIYVTVAGGVDETKLTAIAAAAVDWWTTGGGRAIMSQDLVLARVEALDVSLDNGMRVTAVPSSNQAGAIPSAALTNNVALVTTLLTPYTGRSFRGRIFMPGIPTNQTSGNNIITTYVGDMQNALAALRTALLGEGATWVVASYFANGVARETAVPTAVTSLLTRSRVDTQRRRLPKESS
jgi:hypothetical protein